MACGYTIAENLLNRKPQVTRKAEADDSASDSDVVNGVNGKDEDDEIPEGREFKVAYTSGPIFEKNYEAVPHIFYADN